MAAKQSLSVEELASSIRAAMDKEYAYASRREKEEPDCRYREGVAEGVCDLMNSVNSIINRALRSRSPPMDKAQQSSNTNGDAAMDIALSEAGFVHGAQCCREMMARFVETSPPTDLKVLAGSIRANWHPGWGTDPGPVTGAIPDNPLGDLALHIELLDIDREAARTTGGQ